MQVEFVIHAAPEGKARPRVTMHGTYTPRSTREYEHLIQVEYKRQGGKDFGNAPLFVHIKAYYPIPASASKRNAAKMALGYTVPTKKPDADNIAKAVCDALNGIAYHDDAQIVDLFVRKRYTDTEPRVCVYISEVILK